MNSINDFYKSRNILIFTQGHTQQSPSETKFLKKIVSGDNIKNVMEIGFNAGHSAELFLSTNKNINLVSFDIGEHEYVKLGKEFIDEKYHGRHKLIIGDSLKRIPEFIKENTNSTFDIIFIDGGHTYDVAIGDLMNCKNLSHEKTIVILDDTMNNPKWIKRWNRGPNKAWKHAIENGLVTQIGSVDFDRRHGASWGYYNI